MDSLRQLMDASLSLHTLPLTVLLVLIVLYWIVVIVGAIDIDMFDLNLDLDADADVDVDADVDGDMGGAHSLLVYFNIGDAPFMVWISFAVLSLWVIAVLSNHYLNAAGGFLLGLALLIPNILISVHVAKILTHPVGKLFRALNKGASGHMELVGKCGHVVSSTVKASSGQIEVKTGGAPLLLNARTREVEPIPKGTEIVVLEQEDNAGVCIIGRLTTSTIEKS